MARLTLVNERGQPVRLVLSHATQTEFKRASALPGAAAHATERPWVSFPLEPNRVSDLLAIHGNELAIADDVSAWYDHALRIAQWSRITQQTSGHDWDVSDIPFGGMLYPYQRTGVAWLRLVKRGILGDEMGLGKTLQALGAAYDADPVLVVTVGLAKRSVWDAHLEKYLSHWPVYICEGTGPQRAATLQEFLDAGSHGVVIVNHDMFQARFRTQYHILYTTEWQTVIVDEAHLFQDHRSSRSQGAQALRSKNLYLLTGTPVWNAPESVFGLLKMIDPKRWTSFWAFVGEYCDVAVTPWAKEIVGIKPEKMDDLRALLAPVILRRLETDEQVASQLPPRRVQTITYQLTPAVRAAYRKLKKDYVLKHGDTILKQEPNASQAFADLRRLVNDPRLLGLDIASAKTEILDDLLDEALSENKKVVLFTWHRDYTRLLLSHLLREKKVAAVAIDGSLSESERLAALTEFQRPTSDVRVLVANIATAGTAIDLTVASVAVFVEGSYTAAHVEQAIKRLHRHGQTATTMIYRLQAEHTVESALWDVVDDRTAQADTMLAFNAWRQRTLQED